MHLDIHAVYLRQAEQRIESRAVRAFLVTGGTRTSRFHRRYVENYAPYQVMLNVDRISFYTKTYVTADNNQNTTDIFELRRAECPKNFS